MSPPAGDEPLGGPSDGAERAEEIFFEALERPRSERRELVAARCRGDPELEREVVSLLDAHEQTGPLDRLQGDLARWGEELLEGSAAGLPVAPEETPPDDAPGEGLSRLGRYEILDRLGSGGMAEVFRAHDPRLGRTVAVKVIGRRLGRRPEALERFEQEARAASALSHPNVITIHDFGEQDGHPFLVMELVDGESLRDRLEARPDEGLAVGAIVRLGTQLADGLTAAHAAGVVHRDLKPENVLIDRRGTARILDFGLAVFQVLEPPATPGPAGDEGSTPGPVVGTVGYTAPEVLRGAGADHRADQFALGAILYEMATGRSAFPWDSVQEGLAATLRGEPTPVAELRSDLPDELAGIIERCLARHPEDRYPETGEILGVFEAFVAARGSRAAPGRGRVRSVPAPTTPLVDRAEEMRRLRKLLPKTPARLVTLTGTGGSGKTRLAIEAARTLEPEFPGGVFFVPLAGIRDSDLVLPTVAAGVGGSEAGAVELTSLLASLADAEGPLLLVLDNFEHVIDAAPRIVDLLEACPELTVLATSRERLNVRAEHALPVEPLALPPVEARSGAPSRAEPLGDLSEIPAVALFVERARASRPDFRLTEDNAPAVAELCRRLEGLPLALELAAARVRTLSPGAMLRRLEDRMGLLSGGPRDLPARQRTLRAALDWSHDLLDETERKAFRRLAVFSGGFTLEAAEAVVDPFGALERPVVDLVDSLHGQSLLQGGGLDPEPRFSMLETVREYAAEHLRAHGEPERTRKAHAAYFLVLAEEAGTSFDRGYGSEWLERFRAEEANFRAALDWLIANDHAAWGFRMAQGLFHFWELGESFSEGRRRFDELLALPSARALPRARANALFGAGVLAASQRDHACGVEHHRRALDLYRELDDPRGQAVVLNGLGIQFTDLRRYDEARACYDEALGLWEDLGESHGAAASLSNFAYVLRNQGELARSRELYQDAAAMFERLGDPAGAAWETSHEADVARAQNRPEAARLYRRALERFRELEEPWGIGSTLVDLGRLAQEEGRPDEAGASYREALGNFSRVGHQRGVARVLEALATLAAQREDHPRVLWLAGAAERLRERLGRPPTDPDLERALDAAVAEAYERTGVVEGEAARRRGREQPLEELVQTLTAE